MGDILNIKWGSFTPVHIISLVFAIVLPIAIYFILRKASRTVQTVVLFIMSLMGPFALTYELIVYGIPSSPLQYLPLHLCSYNMLLTPILVLTKNKFLGNLLPLFSVGAFIALIFNSIQADYSIFSGVFFLYYFSHAFGASLPFLMLALRHVEAHPKYILPSVIGTIGLYTISHFANIAINDYLAANNVLDYMGELIQVNYMFSLHPHGNPFLTFLWNILPYSYWYIFLVIPIAAIYFTSLNIGYFIKNKKQRYETPEK